MLRTITDTGAMVGQRGRVHNVHRAVHNTSTTLPRVSIPTITNRRAKHFITMKVTDMKATSNAGIVKMRNAMACGVNTC